MQNNEGSSTARKLEWGSPPSQKVFQEEGIKDLLQAIKLTDPLRTTPMEALKILHELHEKINELELGRKEA